MSDFVEAENGARDRWMKSCLRAGWIVDGGTVVGPIVREDEGAFNPARRNWSGEARREGEMGCDRADMGRSVLRPYDRDWGDVRLLWPKKNDHYPWGKSLHG